MKIIMTMAGLCVIFMTLCLGMAIDGAIDSSGGPGGGGCVYSFQVWTPDQNILDRIRNLEFRCTNSSYRWEQEVHALRKQVLDEMMATRNMSHRMEKELLEQKVEDVQLQSSMKDIKIELMQLKHENDDLRTSVDIQGGTGVTSPMSLSSREVSQMKVQLGGFRGLVGQLKNEVGDLKAEWFIIKREVQTIKTENSDVKFSQNDIKSEALRIKSIVDALQADTTQLKSGQEELKDANNKMIKTMNDIKASGLVEVIEDAGAAEERLKAEVNDIRARNRELVKQIQKLNKKYQELKPELLAVALAARNVSQEEIGGWLQKLPFVQIPSSERTYGHPPIDCQEVYERGFLVSGVYQVQPRTAPELDNVYCEMLNSSGWTVIQRRIDGTLSFNRRWLEYRNGFGNLYGEFWIGNEKLHQLTSHRDYRLRVDLWDWEGQRAYSEYDLFRVGSEKTKYKLQVRGQKGSAGDSMSFHDGMAFSTEDSDNDLHMRNCAVENKGGWWYNSCYTCNLNGVYHSGWYSHSSHTFADGIVWYTWKQSDFYSLKHVEMKIKPSYA